MLIETRWPGPVGCPVDDRRPGRQSRAHRDVGDIGRPDLIRPIEVKAPKQIRIDLMLGVGLVLLLR